MQEPHLIFGTWPLEGDAAQAAIEMALAAGYRALDTAQWYGNEAEVGAAIRATGAKGIRIATKVKPENLTPESFMPSVRESLDRLGTDCVDLLFMHWPPYDDAVFDAMVDTLNDARSAGYCREIAISNATTRLMERAVARSPAKIAVNQIEFHPLINQEKIRATARRLDMSLQGYCSLGRGEALNQPATLSVAKAHGVSEATVILAWILAQGISPVTMTTKPKNAIANLSAETLVLSPTELDAISALRAVHRRVVDIPELNPIWDGI
ncbi:aldo/keto reductase [Fuscibacter oryzae]|uniref:Aldo/keto reductase n=1 Tax=Fuscibacter oryzae TaxID=2803939 RepID=A0A8J7MVP7_9RHOB|nr:aldo/keto reductase [Fuscibacter oryzae]MBL4929408.1 aldo/keto reductase [Fuscibacter oryzae]